MVLDNWIMLYGIYDVPLTDKDEQLTSKNFGAPCPTPDTKLATMTEYDPKCNGKVERYNRTVVERLRHHIEKHLQYWGWTSVSSR